MKPFDLEKARAGHPVCTRNGLKARIICFDRRNDFYPIIALVYDGIIEQVFTYTLEGHIETSEICDIDLMMVSEKKEGWINIYHGKEEEFDRECVGIYKSKE